VRNGGSIEKTKNKGARIRGGLMMMMMTISPSPLSLLMMMITLCTCKIKGGKSRTSELAPEYWETGSWRISFQDGEGSCFVYFFFLNTCMTG